MYRPEEVRTLLQIKDLLYARGSRSRARSGKLQEERKEPPQVEIGFGEAVHKLVVQEVKTELRADRGQLRRNESSAAT
jgi:hypothetical protein